MTYALIAALLFFGYRLRSYYRDNRHLIDATTFSYARGIQRGREQGFDEGFLAGTRTAERAREEGRL